MQKHLFQIFVVSIVFAVGLIASVASFAEGRKPIKPQLRIVDGAQDTTPRKTERTGQSDAARTWKVISGTKDIAVLDRFIAQYPDSIQASLAAQRRGQLTRAAAVPKSDKGEPPEEVFEEAAPRKTANLVFEIQSELSRLGCNPGRADGKWGRKSILAARRFSKYSNIDVETERPNPALLAGARASRAGICPLVCGAKFSAINGRCVAKTCAAGQKLSSKGRCYTPKKAKSCKRGERLSSRGSCYVPKKTAGKKISTPRKATKPKRQRCAWCGTSNGTQIYTCGTAKIAKLRARGDCN